MGVKYPPVVPRSLPSHTPLSLKDGTPRELISKTRSQRVSFGFGGCLVGTRGVWGGASVGGISPGRRCAAESATRRAHRDGPRHKSVEKLCSQRSCVAPAVCRLRLASRALLYFGRRSSGHDLPNVSLSVFSCVLKGPSPAACAQAALLWGCPYRRSEFLRFKKKNQGAFPKKNPSIGTGGVLVNFFSGPSRPSKNSRKWTFWSVSELRFLVGKSRDFSVYRWVSIVLTPSELFQASKKGLYPP